jgi:hypothetical protein
MKTILDLLYVGVQLLRLVLSACIVVSTFLFFNGMDRFMASDFEFALMTLPVFVFWVFAFIALNRILGVIKCCKHLNYFSQSNAQSIKFLAYVLIVYAIGVPFLEFIFKIVELGRLEFSFVIDIEYSFISHLALGLILLLLAKIVERGRELEVDQELTI